MRHILVLTSLLLLSFSAAAKAPFKTIYFAFQNANTLGFQIDYYEGHTIGANTILRFSELESVTFTNFVMIERDPLCVANSKKISCNFKFKALLPACALTGNACEPAAATETQDVAISFTLDKLGMGQYNFVGTLTAADGRSFPLDNDDFRGLE